MFSIIKNVIKRYFKEKMNIFFIIFPSVLVLMLILSQFGTSSTSDEVTKAKLGIIRTNEQSVIVNQLEETLKSNYQLLEYTSMDKARTDMAAGTIFAVMEVHEKADNLFINNDAIVTITQPLESQEFYLLNNLINSEVNILQNIYHSTLATNETVDLTEVITIYNQSRAKIPTITSSNGNTSDYMTSVSGFAIYVLIFAVLRFGKTLMEDRELGTFQRILVTPIRFWQYVTGTVVAWWLLSMLAVLPVTAILWYYGYLTSISQYLLIMTLNSLVLCMMSLLISVIVADIKTATNLQAFIATPLAMFGGLFWPILITPMIMQNIAKLTPVYWSMDAFTKSGVGYTFIELLPNLAVLAGFAFLFLTINVYILKHKNLSKTAM